ncbi:MAG TPA: hypothetical protein VFO01_17145 [Trebonia sp.]|nr:hypothetical protein [Trebonia sp.]
MDANPTSGLMDTTIAVAPGSSRLCATFRVMPQRCAEFRIASYIAGHCSRSNRMH